MTNKERALLVAEKAHANQQYDIYPYMYHIRQVVHIAEDLGYDESIIVAAVLHDTLEDTTLSYNDIKKAFGEEVAEIVYAVTDELGRNRKERKTKTYPKIKANWKATVVKICDRIANMQQSKAYNPRLYQVYIKEHHDFCENLKNPLHPEVEISKAWEKLLVLMGAPAQ
tara:strand:+ start:1045 stop:1551 length:507 start_codon:yes stop_codon:yes gene_type:complete